MKKTILIIAIFLAVKSYSQVWGGSTNTSGNTYRNGYVGIGTFYPLGLLDLGQVVTNRKLILWQSTANNNDNQFYGLGINPFVLRYQVASNDASHIFYSGQTTTSSKELMRISGDGKVGIGTNGAPLGVIDCGSKVTNRVINLWRASDNDHQFYGFGINHFVLRYQVASTDASHVFYSGQTATNSNELMRIAGTGKVSIGGVSSTPGTYKLYVKDGILTEKVKVALSGTANWADYVFSKNYKLKSLSEVESYIKENKHLPNIPSSEEIKADGGLDVAEMMAKQMEKIEELTLYTIQQQKEIEELKNLVKSAVKK